MEEKINRDFITLKLAGPASSEEERSLRNNFAALGMHSNQHMPGFFKHNLLISCALMLDIESSNNVAIQCNLWNHNTVVERENF